MKTQQQKPWSIWLSRLSVSERRLINIGGLIVITALLWVSVYQPINTHINNQAEVKFRLENQLEKMQAMTGTAVNVSTAEVLPVPSNMTFSSWIDQQLRLVKLQDRVNRAEPIDENSLSLWLQGASFDQVIDWVQVMSTRYAVHVDQIDINVVDPDLGLTDIRMRLVK